MQIYLDTSAIGSYFDQFNIFYEKTIKLFHFPDLQFFSGMITVIELESIISRNLDLFLKNADEKVQEILNKLKDSEKIPLIAQYCFKRLKIRLISPITIEKIDFNKSSYDILNTYNLTLKINRDLKLRTLDAIQIASAIEMRIYSNILIDYFVTNDLNILEKKQEIYQKARILPISIDEITKLLNIT
jgi:hypothetical protein